jgi:hypothetical protein
VRIRRVIALALALTVLAGCGQGLPDGVPPTDDGPVSYTLCPPGDPPPGDVNAAAVAVVEARLRALGVEGGVVSLGECIDVAVPGPVADDEALRAVLFGTGLAEVVGVPASMAAEVVPGEPAPGDLALVFDSAGILGATVAGTDLELFLDPAADAALASWTRSHTGERLALVLDGRVLGGLPIDGPIAGDRLRIPIDAAAGLDAAAVAALLASGPLPGDWRQPDAPQG